MSEFECDLKGQSILVVEDDNYSQILMKEIFRHSGADLTYVSSGNEAIKFCENNPSPNFVILDIQLPDIDGIELTTRIRHKIPNSKIIAVTACVYGDIMDRCYKAGMQGYIPKPVNIPELLNIINNCN